MIRVRVVMVRNMVRVSVSCGLELAGLGCVLGQARFSALPKICVNVLCVNTIMLTR